MNILRTSLTIIISSTLLIILYMVHIPPFKTLEYAAYDFRYAMLPETDSSGDFLIVDVDDDSVSQIGSTPWNRAVVADLINKIAECKPKSLAVNIIFADKAADGFIQGTPDRALADAIAETNAISPVVLAFHLHGNSTTSENFPLKNPAAYHQLSPSSLQNVQFVSFPDASGALSEFSGNATKQAFSMISTDGDGIVRHTLLAAKFNNTILMSLGLATLNARTSDPGLMFAEDMLMTQIGDRKFQFPWSGYSAIWFPSDKTLCPRISAWKILKGKFDTTIFKDKIVLIGNGESDMPRFQVPNGLTLDGLEIQIAVMETLKNRNIPLHAPYWGIGAGVISTIILTFLASLTLLPRRTIFKIIIFATIFTGYTALNVHWFLHNRVLITLSAPLLLFTTNAIILNLLLIRQKQ